jgi:hypothetical protein
MVAYTSPLQSNSELQWDSDSYPNQPYNCGPSSVEKVANFYKNFIHYGIEKTRDLGSSRNKTGTNLTEQKAMLTKRGISCDAKQLDAAAIKKELSSGRKPLILWLKMSYIPTSVKGNTFQNGHAVAALANGVVNGVTGIWVNEPNQKRTSSTYKANRFFADKYWIPASKAMNRWVIVPNSPKVVTTRTTLKKKWIVNTSVLNIRSGPSAAKSKVGTLYSGATFTSNLLETNGGSYTAGGKTRRDWLGLIYAGKQAWVAKAFCKEG